MEGDLADKPHIQWRRRILPLVLFVALFFLPGGQISDAGFVSLSRDHHGHELAPVLAQLCNPTIAPHQNQQTQKAPRLETTSNYSRPESNPPVGTHDRVDRAAPRSQEQVKKRADAREELHSIVEEVAARHNVDPALIKAIIMAESGYNPRAVSKKGATGLMQLMPSTAKELGVKEIFDPKDNVEAGVKYFKRLLRRFNGDVKLALAAYNAGSTKVRRYKGVPPIGATKYYVRKVFHYYRLYKKDSAVRTDDA